MINNPRQSERDQTKVHHHVKNTKKCIRYQSLKITQENRFKLTQIYQESNSCHHGHHFHALLIHANTLTHLNINKKPTKGDQF